MPYDSALTIYVLADHASARPGGDIHSVGGVRSRVPADWPEDAELEIWTTSCGSCLLPSRRSTFLSPLCAARAVRLASRLRGLTSTFQTQPTTQPKRRTRVFASSTDESDGACDGCLRSPLSFCFCVLLSKTRARGAQVHSAAAWLSLKSH